MYIPYNPDDYEVVTNFHTCEYHKRHPHNKNYPGCTCGGSWSLRLKKLEDRKPIFEDTFREIFGHVPEELK